MRRLCGVVLISAACACAGGSQPPTWGADSTPGAEPPDSSVAAASNEGADAGEPLAPLALVPLNDAARRSPTSGRLQFRVHGAETLTNLYLRVDAQESKAVLDPSLLEIDTAEFPDGAHDLQVVVKKGEGWWGPLGPHLKRTFDSTAPRLTWLPATVFAERSPQFVLEFSEPLDAQSVLGSTARVMVDGAPVPTVVRPGDPNQVVVIPDAVVGFGSTLSASVDPHLVDLAGNRFVSPSLRFSAQTASCTAPNGFMRLDCDLSYDADERLAFSRTFGAAYDEHRRLVLWTHAFTPHGQQTFIHRLEHGTWRTVAVLDGEIGATRDENGLLFFRNEDFRFDVFRLGVGAELDPALSCAGPVCPVRSIEYVAGFGLVGTAELFPENLHQRTLLARSVGGWKELGTVSLAGQWMFHRFGLLGDGRGHLVVHYGDGHYDSYSTTVRVAIWDGTQMTSLGIPFAGDLYATTGGVTLDSAGTPLALYANANWQTMLTVRRWNGAAWVDEEGPPVPSGAYGIYITRFERSESGEPLVQFDIGSKRQTYKLTSGGWTLASETEFPGVDRGLAPSAPMTTVQRTCARPDCDVVLLQALPVGGTP